MKEKICSLKIKKENFDLFNHQKLKESLMVGKQLTQDEFINILLFKNN